MQLWPIIGFFDSESFYMIRLKPNSNWTSLLTLSSISALAYWASFYSFFGSSIFSGTIEDSESFSASSLSQKPKTGSITVTVTAVFFPLIFDSMKHVLVLPLSEVVTYDWDLRNYTYLNCFDFLTIVSGLYRVNSVKIPVLIYISVIFLLRAFLRE